MRTVSEGARGCGYRKGGGLYLMSDGIGVGCSALPIEMTVCPCCGNGIKPARGWTWIEPDSLLEGYLGPHQSDSHTKRCPLGAPGRLGERAGLLWIGEQHYATPEAWVAEGKRMGFSRRIHNIPRGFKAGETWVLAGHRKAIERGYEYDGEHYASLNELALQHPDASTDEIKVGYAPGIFHVWRPSRVEYVVKGDETDEELAALESRGIEPVKVIRADEQETLMKEEAA